MALTVIGCLVRDAAVCRLLSGADTYAVVAITSQLLPDVHGPLLRLQQVLSCTDAQCAPWMAVRI